MLVFGNDKNTRGCFIAFRMNTSEGRGAQLRLPTGARLPKDSYSYPLTVVGFHFSQAENAHFVKCFGDYVYTYAFGHDPHQSQLVVEFAGMLRKGSGKDLWGTGRAGNGFSELMDDLPRQYEKGRLYKSLKYAKFFIGSNQVLKGFLVNMSSATMDPQVSLQSFSLTLQLVEAQGQ